MLLTKENDFLSQVLPLRLRFRKTPLYKPLIYLFTLTNSKNGICFCADQNVIALCSIAREVTHIEPFR
jgi:hypothetical protein